MNNFSKIENGKRVCTNLFYIRALPFMLGEAGFIVDQSLPLLTMHLQNAVWVQIVFRSDHDPDFDPDSEELVVSVFNGKTQFILEYDHIAQDTEEFGNRVLETIRTLWCQKPLNP